MPSDGQLPLPKRMWQPASAPLLLRLSLASCRAQVWVGAQCPSLLSYSSHSWLLPFLVNPSLIVLPRELNLLRTEADCHFHFGSIGWFFFLWWQWKCRWLFGQQISWIA